MHFGPKGMSASARGSEINSSPDHRTVKVRIPIGVNPTKVTHSGLISSCTSVSKVRSPCWALMRWRTERVCPKVSGGRSSKSRRSAIRTGATVMESLRHPVAPSKRNNPMIRFGRLRVFMQWRWKGAFTTSPWKSGGFMERGEQRRIAHERFAADASFALP